ncbi:MAG: DEAD/DEAH box helicase family protein [Chloroflexi bacterium]|nr:DEAD/DEAH box helicase family protein [Chloroflexota bacterium]
MARFAVHRHPDVRDWTEQHPEQRARLEWLVAQLATRGQAGRPKGVIGPASHVADLPDRRWRRSGVSGSHFYAWWFQADGHGGGFPEQSIVLRAVRHHDETSQPLSADPSADYDVADFHELHPLGQEQEAVVQSPAAVRLVVGHPGTGKTGALLFAAWQEALPRPDARLLYVTLSARLADEARQFFDGLADELHGRVDVMTVDDVLARWAGSSSSSVRQQGPDDEMEEEAFYRFLRMQPPREVRYWQGAETSLWTEVRAYVIGRALPFALDARYLRACTRPLLDRKAYARMRRGAIDALALDQAWDLAQKFVTTAEQQSLQLTAWRAWQQLAAGGHKQALGRYVGFLVDELQDLTLLQLAVLAEAAKRAGSEHGPTLFIAAGDESQIVHPSGFEWGLYKDVLTARLESEPREFQLRMSQRSPGSVVRVIDRSLEFYSQLDKEFRPKGNPRLEPIEGGAGQVYVALVDESRPDTAEWLDTLRETPGVAIVRTLTERGDSPLDGARYADLCFSPSTVKGLDRDYVLIWDASASLAKLRAMFAAPAARSGPRQAEARRAIDELRVAISRSTETLIFVDQPGEERDLFLEGLVNERLAAEQTVAFLHDDLLERGQDAQLRAQGFLSDALELLEVDLDRALRVLVQADAALKNILEAGERQKMLPTRVRVRLQAARALLRRERWPEAADQFGQLVASYRELGQEEQAELFELLDSRYRESPPGSTNALLHVPELQGETLGAWRALPESERDPDLLELLRRWRDEMSHDLLELPAAAELEECIAGLSLKRSRGLLASHLFRSALDLASTSGEEEDRTAALAVCEIMGDSYTARENWAEALSAYQQLPHPPVRNVAACHEGLANWSQAAELYLEAGDRRAALSCLRRGADLERAGELARELGENRLAETLKAATRLTDELTTFCGEPVRILNGAELEKIAGLLERASTQLRQARPVNGETRRSRRR